MSNVWIPKSAGHDFTAADRYGSVQFVYTDSQHLFNPERLLEAARDRMAQSTAKDYFLPSGPQLMNIMAFIALLERHGVVRLLLFDARTDVYQERCYYGQQNSGGGRTTGVDFPKEADAGRADSVA